VVCRNALYPQRPWRGQRNGFISFIAALSVAGIALGVAALIVVLSVMNGFQKEVRDRMLSVLSHIEVYGNVGVPDWREVASKAKQDPRLVGAAPFAAGQVVVTRDETVRGAAVRGIDPQEEPTVSDIAAQMRSGKLTDLVPGNSVSSSDVCWRTSSACCRATSSR
jgi:lipoprotein-releasing system permease protein